jgi:hypothetical protein
VKHLYQGTPATVNPEDVPVKSQNEVLTLIGFLDIGDRLDHFIRRPQEKDEINNHRDVESDDANSQHREMLEQLVNLHRN